MTLTLQQKKERLAYHQEMYYNGFVKNIPDWLEGESPISDAEYDALYDDVKAIDPNDPVITGVGSKAGNIKHNTRMGSLAKVKKIEDLKDWFLKYSKNSNILVCMPKIDGLSLSLRYGFKGAITQSLQLGVTRGDGIFGDDCTNNAKTVNGIPPTVEFKDGNIEFRGECIMPRSVFKRLNDEGFNFANPRNAASGSLKQDDSSECAKRGLVFLCYESVGNQRQTQMEEFRFLKKHGFEEIPETCSFTIKNNDFSDVEKYIKYFGEKIRPNLDFATDGLVFCLNSMKDQEEAGWSSNNHHPNGKIAYKFDPEEKETVILSKTFQVGKTGRIVPVANLKPVNLDGSTVSCATCHTYGRMVEKGWMNGAVIKIVKANDIIPYIKEVVTPVSVFEALKEVHEYPKCPCCGSETEFDGVNLWCTNENCEERLISRIVNFMKTTRCLGVGEKTVEALVKNGTVTCLYDMFDGQKVNTSSVKIAQKTISNSTSGASNIVRALAELNNLDFHVYIEALGLTGVGKGTAKHLADFYKNPINLVHAKKDELISIPDIGEKTADTILSQIVKRMDDILWIADSIKICEPKSFSGNLTGKSFLFTGTLSKPRKYFEELVIKNGGTLASSVGRNLSYLVTGEDCGSKLIKAQKLGITLLTEDEFLEML